MIPTGDLGDTQRYHDMRVCISNSFFCNTKHRAIRRIIALNCGLYMGADIHATHTLDDEALPAFVL